MERLFIQRALKSAVNQIRRRYQLCIRLKETSSTSASYLSALRPFYLAVHPDFFTQYPVEKAINEDSLKLLHCYFDDLVARKHASPVRLTFYLKRRKDQTAGPSTGENELRSVTVQLRSNDLLTSVHDLLNVCSLPLGDIIKERKERKASLNLSDISVQNQELNNRKNKPSTFKGRYTFYGDMDFSFENEAARERQKKPGDLPRWFLNNIPTARVRMRSSEPVITENKEIIRRMQETLGLKSFVLQSPVYNQSTLNGALKQLESLFLNKWTISSVLLQQKVLTVGNFNGVDHIGRLVFDITDVPSAWTEALTRMNDIDDLADVLRVPELRVSELLNGLKITRDLSAIEAIPIETYYKWVTKLLENLRESQKKGETITGVYSGLKAQVTKPRMFASVSPEGNILLPCVTTMAALDRFLAKNARIALEKRRDHARAVKEELDISEFCRKELGLRSLLKDRLITPGQMVAGCKKLLDSQPGLLNDTRVIISNYYGITGDGDIRIPWDAGSVKAS